MHARASLFCQCSFDNASQLGPAQQRPAEYHNLLCPTLQVAFLVAMLGPKVAVVAAQHALGVLAKEDLAVAAVIPAKC